MAPPAGAQSVAPAVVQQSLRAKYPGVESAKWTQGPDRSFSGTFRLGGANLVAKFTTAGQWIESATEIGAIMMPELVRTALVKGYRGFQVVDARRIDRATPPTPLFELHLARASDKATVQFESSGEVWAGRKPARELEPEPAPTPASELTVLGTWRGESTCGTAYTACQADSVIYHFTAVAVDTAGFDVRMNRIVAGEEVPGGWLACTLDRGRAAVICIAQAGIWRFTLRHDSLVGGLALRDGTPVRRVAVHRQP